MLGRSLFCSRSLDDRSGPSWGVCAPRLSDIIVSTLIPSLTPIPSTPQRGILGTAAVRNVRNKRENREIEYGVRGDGDPQKPAKSPCEGFAWSRSYEFGEFQARR